jgi:hypothetical protein
MRRLLLLLIIGTPAGSNTGEYEGAMFEQLPLLEGSQAAANTQITPALGTIGQIHRETVRAPKFAYFTR